jgi:hypothetical protein
VIQKSIALRPTPNNEALFGDPWRRPTPNNEALFGDPWRRRLYPIFFVFASVLASGNVPSSSRKIWGASLADFRFLNHSQYIRKTFFLLIFAISSLYATPLAEQFKRVGYVEIINQKQEAATFHSLYAYFDELIEFLQANPAWAQKLYCAKERFIRSKERNYYSTDFFGFYDESKKEGRNLISFYYSTHFHEFIGSRYPELNQAPEIIRFFETCLEIQKPYGNLFDETAAELGLGAIFSSKYGHPPILFKVVKYLPSYTATRPHYDGTAFSLFLDSTDNQSLLLSPYKSSFTVEDFSSPLRDQNSILLIPGALLKEFSIYPTPHMVTRSGKTRYAAIAFAMRPNYIAPKIEHSPLPNFQH